MSKYAVKLVLFTLFLSLKSFASNDVILFFQTTESAKQITAMDYSGAEGYFAVIQDLLDKSTQGVQLIKVELSHLSEAAKEAKNVVPSDSNIVGLIFAGHGNSETFHLNDSSYKNGEGMARTVIEVLSGQTTKAFVYIHSCLNGQCSLKKPGFNALFANTYSRELQNKNNIPRELNLMTHVNLSNPELALAPIPFATAMQKTGMPYVSNQLTMASIQFLPRELAGVTNLLTPFLTLLVVGNLQQFVFYDLLELSRMGIAQTIIEVSAVTVLVGSLWSIITKSQIIRKVDIKLEDGKVKLQEVMGTIRNNLKDQFKKISCRKSVVAG